MKTESPRKATQPESTISVTAQIERELVASALAKRRRGKQPSYEEKRALKRYERAREEELRWHYYQTIPKKHWVAMAEVQHTQIQRHAERWNLPLADSTINLREVIQAFHKLLSQIGKQNLRVENEPDGSIVFRSTPGLTEEYWKWKAKNERLKYQERTGMLCPKVNMHNFLQRVSDMLKDLGTTIEKISPLAGVAFQERLDDIEEFVDEFF